MSRASLIKETNHGNQQEYSYLWWQRRLDWLDHNLLMTKHSWYGVTTKSLNPFFYPRNQAQGVRVNNSYSRKSKIMYAVPQGLVLGLLPFHIDFIGLIMFLDNVSSYADDTTANFCAKHFSSVITKLEEISKR